MKIVAISDTHNEYSKLIIPECDILISAGDYSSRGYDHEVRNFHKWLDLQPAKHIISVQGNHELGVEIDYQNAKTIAVEQCPRVRFIDEGPIEIEGINFWCSAITPFFCDWAWNRHPEDIQKHWDMIPEDTNILITHGPPYGILDQTTYVDGTIRPDHLGCPKLMERIKTLKDLDLHFYGHIHYPGGRSVNAFGTSFYNCAVCDELYTPTNGITVVEYDKDL
jgi:Icc-related predicted phosphoesterase